MPLSAKEERMLAAGRLDDVLSDRLLAMRREHEARMAANRRLLLRIACQLDGQRLAALHDGAHAVPSPT